MCGLAAVFAHGPDAPPVDGEALLKIREAMRARGPDDAGTWIAPDRRVGLAHRRLSIIDLSAAAAQPMTLIEGGYRIVFNGEIYNFRALRADLEAKGERFQTQSDTEVILRLYKREGAAMVPKLRGMFTFAIWDEAKTTLFLARDPFGIKPIYYADDGKTFRTASTVKALLAGGGIDTSPEPAGHVGYFLFGYVPDPFTVYRGVRALEAGHTLTLTPGSTPRIHRYFDLQDGFIAPPNARPPDLRRVLLESVEHHMVADVPVGVFLSAGMDSTTIAALAAEGQNAGLDTFTLGFREFQGTARDEVPLAEETARVLGTRHKTDWIEGRAFKDGFDGLVAAMDQPTIDGANTYFVAKAARGAGLKVALSGLGGDELLGGYDTFAKVPALTGAIGWIPGARCIGTALRVVAAPVVKHFTTPKAAAVLELGTRASDAYLLRRGLFMPWELADVLDPDLAREGLRTLDPLVRLAKDCDRATTDWRRVQALELAWYMRNQLLRDSDWAGMAHSLEIRVPLVDAWLFRELAPWLDGPDRPTKRKMAETPKKPLPRAVLDRPKTGFAVPVTEWIRGNGHAEERGYRGWARHVHARYFAA